MGIINATFQHYSMDGREMRQLRSRAPNTGTQRLPEMVTGLTVTVRAY